MTLSTGNWLRTRVQDEFRANVCEQANPKVFPKLSGEFQILGSDAIETSFSDVQTLFRRMPNARTRILWGKANSRHNGRRSGVFQVRRDRGARNVGIPPERPVSLRCGEAEERARDGRPCGPERQTVPCCAFRESPFRIRRASLNSFAGSSSVAPLAARSASRC